MDEVKQSNSHKKRLKNEKRENDCSRSTRCYESVIR